MSPARWVASASHPARGKPSGLLPSPSTLVGMTLGLARTGADPAGSAGDDSGFPTASWVGLTGGGAQRDRQPAVLIQPCPIFVLVRE